MLVCKSNRDRIITIERVKFSADKGLFWLLFDNPDAERMNLAGARCTMHTLVQITDQRLFMLERKKKRPKHSVAHLDPLKMKGFLTF